MENKICAHCKNDILESDESIICPICNQTFHNDCWIKNGGCDKHGLAGNKEKTLLTDKFCKKCGASIEEGQQFCSKCGFKLVNNTNNKYLALTPLIKSTLSKFSRKKLIIIGTVFITIIAVIAIISVISEKSIQTVYNDIGGDGFFCTIAYDDSYMSIDTNPYDIDDSFDLTAWDMIKKANMEFGFSESLSEKMLNTRALDGMLTDENDHIRVSWTYHPDSGIEVLYESI